MSQWAQIALSVGIGLLTAGGALVGVKLSVRGNDRATRQREYAARREEWWRRFTWAADLALDESATKRVAGLRLLAKLAQSDLAGPDEYLLLDAFHERVLNKVLKDQEESGEQQ